VSPRLKSLHELWRIRLNDARRELRHAQRFVGEVREDLVANNIPFPDSSYAYRQAITAETLALQQFNRVLRIFGDLIINGVIPDEEDWRRNRMGKPTA
jgi:hypothetical protein